MDPPNDWPALHQKALTSTLVSHLRSSSMDCKSGPAWKVISGAPCSLLDPPGLGPVSISSLIGLGYFLCLQSRLCTMSVSEDEAENFLDLEKGRDQQEKWSLACVYAEVA